MVVILFLSLGFFCFVFLHHACSAQDLLLLLVLCSGITPGCSGGPHMGPRIDLALVMCKASTLLLYYLSDPM